MNEKSLTLSKAALIELLISAYPNPEDDNPPHRYPFGPHDPIGPISRLEQAALNPQPLPPLTSRLAGGRSLLSLSDFRKGTLIARGMIETAMARIQLGDLSSAGGRNGQVQEAVLSSLLEEVDEFCGTNPPGFPWWWWFIVHPIPIPDPGPDPPIRPGLEVSPVVLLTAGTEFALAARSLRAGGFQKALDQGADRFFNAGLSRLEAGRSISQPEIR